MGYLMDKMRWMRIAVGAAVVLVLALGAGGDVAGRKDSAPIADVAAPDIVASGFLYGDWLRGRRVATLEH